MKKSSYKFLLIICSLIAAACLVIIGFRFYNAKTETAMLEELSKGSNTQKNEEKSEEKVSADEKDIVQEGDPKKDESVSKDESSQQSQESEIGKNQDYLSLKNFEELKKINEEIIAWVTIEDTVIDYPICFNPDDNSYYLTHNYQKIKRETGSLFIENCNSPDFSDYITIIYGHNTSTGIYFGPLHDFEKREFFDSHENITVYFPDCEKHYTIFAARFISDSHILAVYDKDDVQSRQALLEDIYSDTSAKCYIREGLRPDAEAHILILSTCTWSDSAKRYVVYAVEN